MLMRIRGKTFIILLIALLITTGMTEANGKTKIVHEGPVVLKMNDYYIIYTYPKGPYIDNNNRLIIPLRSVSDLIGAVVTYDGYTKTATVTMEEHTVQVTVGSTTAIVDDQPLEMDTVAVLEKGSMLIPARILFDSFGFKSKIDERGVVCIQDERLYTEELAKELRRGGFFYQEENGRRHGTDFFYRQLVSMDLFGWLYMKERNIFQPLSYRIAFRKSEDDDFLVNNTTASYQVENVSGQAVPEGHEDFHVFYYDMNLTPTGTRDNSILGGSTLKNRPRLAREKDEIFVVDEEVETRREIKYILGIGRTLSTPKYGK